VYSWWRCIKGKHAVRPPFWCYIQKFCDIHRSRVQKDRLESLQEFSNVLLWTNKVVGSTFYKKQHFILISRQELIVKWKYYFKTMWKIQSHRSSSSPLDPVSIDQTMGASVLSPLPSIRGNGLNVSCIEIHGGEL
jgi:hypothetical protein